MSFNLIDAAKGLFTNELLQKASAFLGEEENNVARAISGVVPGVLSGIADKTTTGDGAAAIAHIASEHNGAGILDKLGNFFGNEEGGGMLNKGAGLLNTIVGEQKSGMLTNLIAAFSGIKNSSASSLLSMAVPAVLGLLGKHAAADNLNANGLAGFLASQKDSITAAAPAGLDLVSIFGSKAANIAGSAGWSTNAGSAGGHHTPAAATTTEEEAGGAMRWLLPLLLLALLAAGALYFWNGCNKKPDTGHGEHNATPATGHGGKHGEPNKPLEETPAGKVDSTGTFIYDEGEILTLVLPNNGGELKVGKNSTEAKLINFLNDKNAVPDTVKGNWFEFTNVRFKTGSADLTDESMVQLKNLATISKAYPTAQFKIGGYTDSTGSAATNIALSQKRADAVAAVVKKLGAVATAIVSAKGYGPEHPIASNATKEGQAMNRRVAVNVKAK